MAAVGIDVVQVEGLKMLLAKAGLSQAEFARQLGCSVNTVNAWCGGRNVGSLAFKLAVRELERLAANATN